MSNDPCQTFSLFDTITITDLCIPLAQNVHSFPQRLKIAMCIQRSDFITYAPPKPHFIK